MKNNTIANVLKAYRKKNNLQVKDVAIMLSNDEKKVAEKTIYGWESGQSKPDSETFLQLCHLYNIKDISFAFGLSEIEDFFNPSKHESEVLLAYRKQPELHLAIDRALGVEPESQNTFKVVTKQ